MKTVRHTRLSQAVRGALLLAVVPFAALAQDADTKKTLDTIEVTGSRIKQSDAVTSAPVAVITREQLDKTGVQSVGEVLQQLTSGGKALNAKFNSSGNFGYPPDGGGIGAGSAQVDLRNLESKRVLVLVDGIRWVNESSASGVSGSADLNTIPLAIVDRIEVLEDGASAIYGSDAIAGVVNVITRKSFDGAAVHAYYGEYSEGDGKTTQADVTIGGSGDRFTAVFGASYYDQERVSSADRSLSRFPVPFGGLDFASSATPQGRFRFCDPTVPTGNTGSCADGSRYSLTLDTGTTTPIWDGLDPTGVGTYHGFTSADRFNFAPYNLLLTPSQRKSLFTSVTYDITDNTRLHAKALYNTRSSTNQAAPEPLFLGPAAGTGGRADNINISGLNPFNPFGFDLVGTCPDGSHGALGSMCSDGITQITFQGLNRRPIEAGPRIFKQDVDTWYFNVGLDGQFGDGYDWKANYVHTENKASQDFQNGFNLGHVALALGDPALCAAVAGCTPLDVFGGQGRPITDAMLAWVRTDQHDESKQVLDLFSADLTGDLFNIGDRTAAFAIGVEHRKYQGDFNPDPLRQTGDSQDSFAAPVSASYHVNEVYGELSLPFTSTFDADVALRWSNYSTFGSANTGKLGLRWQPIQDLVLRGTYSTGFRAPNLGELYGLTTFAPPLTDPCSGAVPGNANCVAQGVPPGFVLDDFQTIVFTGGNPNLKPEKSHSYTVGAVYSPSWAEDLSWSKKLDFELSYYNHRITDAIQAPDIQAILNGCADGSIPLTDARCLGITRMPSGQLNPPHDFLDNIGTIDTDGIDVKVNWISPEFSFGQLSASLQTTHVIGYKATGSQRTVGIEVNDSAIPDYQTNVQLGWKMGNWDVAWNVRYISAVKEFCNGDLAGLPGCPTATSMRTLGSTTYNDIQLGWDKPFDVDGLKFSLGVNNAFNRQPPACLTCSLNGYDAGTYDIPGGRFWYASIDYKF